MEKYITSWKTAPFKSVGMALVFVMLNLVSLKGQNNIAVNGIVTDSESEPLIGVSIMITGTQIGTISDIDGSFSLDNVPEKGSFTFSYIGFQTKDVTIDGRTELIVELESGSELLDEVIVVGYGTKKKSDLTGAVQRLDATKYESNTTTNLLEMLSGTIAGFNSSQSSFAQGGGSMEIRGQTSLKASNSPLIVLDGVIYNGVITDINPSDIATIDVLKDASSAAVYGARAASGVLIVTTKRGSSGKPKISFSTKLGTSSLTNVMRPFSPEEYLEARGENAHQTNPNLPRYYYTNPDDLPSDISVEEWMNYDVTPSDDPEDMWLNRLTLSGTEKKNYRAGKTTDWYDEVFQKGFRQDYDLSVSGGNDAAQYYISGGYTSNEGVRLGDKFNVFRSRVNLDIKANDWIKFNADVNFSNRNHGFEAANIGQAVSASPYGQIYAEDGTMEWYTHEDLTSANPLIYYTYRERFNPVQSLFSTVSAEVSLPFGIKYRPSFVNNLRWIRDYRFDPIETPNGFNNNGYGSRSNTTVNEWMIDNLLTWEKDFGGVHHLDFTFLYNAEKNQSWNDFQSNSQFSPNDALSFHGLQSGINASITNNDEYSTGNAIMGRVNYSLMSKYLLTLTMRRDGYSAFGQENPYAYFPSAAFAWRISEENFFNSNAIDYLKLRLSWGANGNRSIGIYDALARLNTTRYLYGNVVATGVFSSTMSNSGLKWESTEAFNLGLDFEIFDSRFFGSLDLYQMKTTDLLVDRSLPVIIGYSSVASNLGEMQNRGLELTLNSRNIKSENFNWNSSLVFSLNRNKIVHLYGEIVDVLDSNGNVIGQKEADDVTNQWFIGQSIDRIWDYEILGIWQLGEEEEAKVFGKTPGDVKLKDQNGDGILTPEDDKIFQGYTEPQYRIGFGNDFQIYKNWSVNLFFRADIGYYGNNPIYRSSQWIDRANILYAPYWTEDNPSNEFPKLDTEVGSPAYGVWKNRSFLRLQDVSITYSFNQKALERAGIQSLKTFLSFRNYMTFTNWNHWDPETLTSPMPKHITIGLNLNL